MKQFKYDGEAQIGPCGDLYIELKTDAKIAPQIEFLPAELEKAIGEGDKVEVIIKVKE